MLAIAWGGSYRTTLGIEAGIPGVGMGTAISRGRVAVMVRIGADANRADGFPVGVRIVPGATLDYSPLPAWRAFDLYDAPRIVVVPAWVPVVLLLILAVWGSRRRRRWGQGFPLAPTANEPR